MGKRKGEVAKEEQNIQNDGKPRKKGNKKRTMEQINNLLIQIEKEKKKYLIKIEIKNDRNKGGIISCK